MTGWRRRAGRGRTDDGVDVTWSLAEGRRGARWREAVATGEGIRSSLLLELDPDGRFSHLELSTPAGLLTLHPEGDGTLHGNAVVAGGVRHVVGRAWDRDAFVLLEGSPVCRAAAAGRRGGEPDRPVPTERPVLEIGLDLSLRDGRARVDGATWATDAGEPRLVDGASWPLELEKAGDTLR